MCQRPAAIAINLEVNDKEIKIDIPDQPFNGEATLWLLAIAPEKKKVKGYHETDHIRQYYETTRI